MSITTVFANGGSQAVRIPKEYRFDTDRVSIQPMRGGILLMPIRRKPSLEEFFSECDTLTDAERDFLSECKRNEVSQREGVFE